MERNHVENILGNPQLIPPYWFNQVEKNITDDPAVPAGRRRLCRSTVQISLFVGKCRSTVQISLFVGKVDRQFKYPYLHVNVDRQFKYPYLHVNVDRQSKYLYL